MTFQLPVAEEKVKPHQVTGLHLLSAFVIGGTGTLFYLLYPSSRPAGAAMMGVGALLLILALFRNKWLVRPATTRVLRIVELLVLVSAALYTGLQHKWIPTLVPGSLAIAVLFALFWENGADTLQILVSKEGIKLPLTSRRRFVHWYEVEQVLLRYGVLTIDCFDNRLFQYKVLPEGVDKDLFEEYCNTNITASIDKREKDW